MELAEFEQVVVEVIAELPEVFRRHLAHVEVIVEERPNRDIRQRTGIKPWQTVYGLYDGVPITERSSDFAAPPDTIYIFRMPLERDFRTPTALREEIRRTVLHEIAHHFGISDERLHELGAY